MNIYEKVLEMGNDIDSLKMLLRIGVVTELDEADRSVKLTLTDDTVTTSMPVLYCGNDWLPEIGDTCVFLMRPAGDGIVLGKCL